MVRKFPKVFAKWREASFKIYPDHPLREKGDSDLIDRSVQTLVRDYKDVTPEFVHGHLSDGDFYQVKDQVVILSNLYWSWRAPFYDTIFGYHWYMYHLNDVPDITPDIVEGQRNLWMEQINIFAGESPQNRRLLNLALLERAAAGLNLDALSCDPAKPISKFLIERTRQELDRLLTELS